MKQIYYGWWIVLASFVVAFYVADKLGVSRVDLVDEDVMYDLRKDLGIGVVTPKAGGPEGMLAKCRVADLLDIEINSVQRFKSLMT